MSFGKIFIGVIGMAALFSLFIHWMTSAVTPPAGTGLGGNWEVTVPRAPSEAKKNKNPIDGSVAVVAQAKAIYEGKGICFMCHGMGGYGDGESGKLLNPPPTNFTDGFFQRSRTDGELQWVIVHGSSGTGMLPYSPRFVSEEESWMLVHYLRTFGKD